MAVPFEMLSAPGALIPSLTNLIAAYANKTRSERERAREDKHRDFAQRLQLRGMELQEQNAEFHREATELERERRATEFAAQQELREAEDARRQAAHKAGMDERERALKMQEYEALRMQEQEGLELDEEGEPTGRRTVDPLRRMQLGVELGLESPDALERYMQQRQLQEAQANMFTGLVDDGGLRYQDINEMSPDQAEGVYKGYVGTQPYLQSLDPEMQAIAEALLGRRQAAASAERYRAGQNPEKPEDFANNLAMNLTRALPSSGVVMPFAAAAAAPLAERLAAMTGGSKGATEPTDVSDEAAAEYWARQAASRKPSGPTPEEVAAFWARQAGR